MVNIFSSCMRRNANCIHDFLRAWHCFRSRFGLESEKKSAVSRINFRCLVVGRGCVLSGAGDGTARVLCRIGCGKNIFDKVCIGVLPIHIHVSI